MITNGRQTGLTYETKGDGVHKWEAITNKPFAEFKDELNEAYENSWVRILVGAKWIDKKLKFDALGADGDIEWSNGKVSARLSVQGIPSKWFEQKIVYETGQMVVRACEYARTAEIEAENKESLRQSALDTYREACINEFAAGVLISRWQKVDESTKLLAALTSSTSAVTGWFTIQHQGLGERAWAYLAGTAAVLSTAHVALKVSDRVKDWSDTKGHFVRLRTELETFLYQMKVNPAFSLDDFSSRFEALRTRFGEGVDRKKVDPLAFGFKSRAEAEAREMYDALRERTKPLSALPVVARA